MSINRSNLADCRAAMRCGSRSFSTAGRLLPRSVRDPATALYAFCRAADDAVDLAEDKCARLTAIDALRDRLDAVYAGSPSSGVDCAFAGAVAAGAIPRALPDALLQGFAWDAAQRQYHDLPALIDYAMRVAGSVGVMMALLMGARSPAVLGAAADLGCAMQLTNIARDVGEDARAGRLYLPRAWLAAAGIDPAAFLANPAHSPALAGIIQRLLQEADALYARALPGIACLPLRCRPAIRAAAALYHAIGAALAGSGFDAVSRRAVVTGRRKLPLVARALLPARSATLAEPGAAALPLLIGIATPGAPQPLWRQVDDTIGWVAELFARLAAEDRTAA